MLVSESEMEIGKVEHVFIFWNISKRFIGGRIIPFYLRPDSILQKAIVTAETGWNGPCYRLAPTPSGPWMESSRVLPELPGVLCRLQCSIASRWTWCCSESLIRSCALGWFLLEIFRWGLIIFGYTGVLFGWLLILQAFFM